MTTLDYWDFATFTTKWLGYCSSAVAIGGAFGQLTLFRSSAFRRSILVYVVAGCLVGMFASLMNFFIQVGAFAEQGLAGMFDPLYLDFLWTSSIRTALLLKLAGFSLLAVAGVTSWWALHDRLLLTVATALTLAGIVLLSASYQEVGHSAEAAGLVRAAVFLHVVAMGLWIGNLYPLRRACFRTDPIELAGLMKSFGSLAVGIVTVLLVCGIFLITALLGGLGLLVTSTYGLGLLLKLALVTLLLGIAALNKLFWVPRLESDRARHGLARSIDLEMVVAATVFAVTAAITTFTGPQMDSVWTGLRQAGRA